LQDAMRNALRDAKVSPDDIDYVNAHAPSTPIGDASEMKALNQVFAGNKIKVSSTKALTGHGLSLSSIMEAAFCCLSLKNGFLPGSANVENVDPEIGHLELLRDSTEADTSLVMSNSSGFGGANVSLVLGKA